MVLAADKPRNFELGDYTDLPVAASTTIYEGSAVGDNASGYARKLVSGDVFRGFCAAKADNASGSAGDINARIRTRGQIILPFTGLALTDIGRPVFASDDETFALSGAGSFIGYIKRYVSATEAVVEYDALRPESVQVISIPLQLVGITGNVDVVTTWTAPFNGRIKKTEFAVTKIASTASKAATLNFEIGTTNLTGGVIALTSTNCGTLGAIVAGTAVTADNAFKAGDTISLEASSVTAFVEGDGVLLLTVTR